MPPTQITGLRAAPYYTISLTMPLDLGAGSYLLGILYGTVSGSGVNSIAVCGIWGQDGVFTEIGQSDQSRKAASVAVWREGRDAHMIATQEAQPKSGGNTSTPFLYAFPDTLPTPLPVVAVDNPARVQAQAATNTAKAALAKAEKAQQGVDELKAGGVDQTARDSVQGLAAALRDAAAGFD